VVFARAESGRGLIRLQEILKKWFSILGEATLRFHNDYREWEKLGKSLTKTQPVDIKKEGGQSPQKRKGRHRRGNRAYICGKQTGDTEGKNKRTTKKSRCLGEGGRKENFRKFDRPNCGKRSVKKKVKGSCRVIKIESREFKSHQRVGSRERGITMTKKKNTKTKREEEKRIQRII